MRGVSAGRPRRCFTRSPRAPTVVSRAKRLKATILRECEPKRQKGKKIVGGWGHRWEVCAEFFLAKIVRPCRPRTLNSPCAWGKAGPKISRLRVLVAGSKTLRKTRAYQSEGICETEAKVSEEMNNQGRSDPFLFEQLGAGRTEGEAVDEGGRGGRGGLESKGEGERKGEREERARATVSRPHPPRRPSRPGRPWAP